MTDLTPVTLAPNTYSLKGRIIMFGIFLVCLLGAMLALIWMLLALIVGSNRAWSLAQAFDRVVNAATGGNNEETISSRSNRIQATTGWACVLCKLLDYIQPNHCEDSAGV